MFETTYDLHLVGRANGQEIRNTFGYRLGAGVDASIFPLWGAQPVAEEFQQEVLPAILDCIGDNYAADRIEVYPHNGLGLVVLSLPYVKFLNNQVGKQTSDDIGPAAYVTMRANLEPMTLLESFTAPKRGWVNIGPICEGQITNGRLEEGWFNTGTTAFGRLATAMSKNLEGIDPPAVYYPVRLAKKTILKAVTVVGYADVMDWSVNPVMKMSRSRLPEN